MASAEIINQGHGWPQPDTDMKIESRLSAEYIRHPMRKHHKTIKGLAATMNITQKRVRQVRANGVTGNAYVRGTE